MRDDERGATLILVTLSLVVLMGFAAFAIDAAAARSQRRENQGAIDTAALSAIQLTANKLQATAVADATTEVIRISYESLYDAPGAGDPTFAEWQAAWAACVDADKPGSYTITGTSDCVSFEPGLRRMRARVPAIDVETTFGAVLGRDSISTGAVAVVEVNLAPGSGAILPFGLPGSAAADPHVCLKTGPTPLSEDPCDGPTSGNFSFLDVTQFGYEPYGTTPTCNGSEQTRLARNIAQGIDHSLSEAPLATSPLWLDRALCTDGNFSSRPYSLTTQTGTAIGPALMDGFVDGAGGLPGRIAQGTGPTATVRGNTIDDRPLWYYFNGSESGPCGGSPSTHDDLIACLGDPANYDAGGNWIGGIIFRDDLAAAERFAWVPLFWDPTLGTGSTDHNIQDFRPVYIQTTFWNCNALGCRYTHDPGEGVTAGSGPGGPANIESLSAIQIPFGALPTSISVDGNPDSPGTLVYSLIE